jgi:hypothetical protein
VCFVRPKFTRAIGERLFYALVPLKALLDVYLKVRLEFFGQFAIAPASIEQGGETQDERAKSSLPNPVLLDSRRILARFFLFY